MRGDYDWLRRIVIRAEELTSDGPACARPGATGDAGARCLLRKRREALWRRAVIALVLGLASVGLSPAPSPAQQADDVDRQDEYDVKAAFLYHFGRYVEWPKDSSAGSPEFFVIGILGNAPFGGVLEEIAAKKTMGGRKIVVRRFASFAEYRPPCHILFVSRSLSLEQQTRVAKEVSLFGVLLVGETPGFADIGGAVNFFNNGGRVRFEVNSEAAKRSQLRMDAKLLSLGKPVHDRPPSPREEEPRPVAAPEGSSPP